MTHGRRRSRFEQGARRLLGIALLACFGERILRFFEGRGISWTVWCFHTEWTPSLLEDWRCTPTRPAGELFRGALLQHD